MPKIQIHDETLGAKSGEGASFDFDIPSGQITARELIASRVEEEVLRHNAQIGEIFRGLVQPSESEKLRDGYRLKSPRPLDTTRQIERALHAFESNGFFLLVDEKQVESLDETLEIGLKSRVSFVKLVPLVGG